MNKESRDTSSVMLECWHDWGERRLISSGGSMAYEYAIRGCLVFALTAAQASCRKIFSAVNLMAQREAAED